MKPILEYIATEIHQSILAFRHDEEDFQVPWHFHPQHELTYIEASVGTKFIGDYVGPYVPGELVLISANLPHCWKNQANQLSRSVSTVVQWKEELFPSLPELDSVFKMMKAAENGLIFQAEEVSLISDRIAALSRLDGVVLFEEFISIMIEISQFSYKPLSISKFTENYPVLYNSRMEKIHEFIELQYHRKIYLEEIAGIVHMSEQSFSRFFSKMMGRPFFSFLNEYRIHQARRMLINTDWSVSKIGFACGYDSLPFFFKQFHKLNQSTPLKYRLSYR